MARANVVAFVALLGAAVPVGLSAQGWGSARLPTQRLIIAMRSGDTHLPEPFDARDPGARFATQRASVSLRFRSLQAEEGGPIVQQAQYQVAFNGSIRLDPQGRVRVHGGVFTGSSFTGGWNRTGWGEGGAQLHLSVKHLYLAADPVELVRWQGGGIPPYQGQASELSAHSSDGYLVGHRLTVARPAQLFFDEIVLTAGYLGDLDRPGIGRRIRRLDEVDYGQVVLLKHFGRRASVSVEAATWEGVPLFRQAVRLAIPESRVVEVVHFEQYQRRDALGRYGFAAYAERHVGTSLAVGAGWHSTDPRLLNADRYGQGERLFFVAHRRVTAGLSFAAYLTPGFVTGMTAEPQSRVDLVVGWNVLALAGRAR